MNSLQEAFERQAGNAGTPDLDIDELVGLGEHRLRRRRLTAIAASGAALVLAIGLAIGGAAVIRSADQQQGPIDRPPKPDQTQTTTPTTPRPVVYSDVTWRDGLTGDPIHVGDRAVATGSGWVHMAVTDTGVVYASGGYKDDGRLWFTDGGTPVQIAAHACPSARGWPGSIITGNSGPLVAWFDCTPKQNPRTQELVVYDTSSGREVGRVQHPGGLGCAFDTQLIELLAEQCTAIIGDGVYTRDRLYTARGGVLISSDGRATGSSFLRDLRSNPRGLVVGDSWDTGSPTTAGVFSTVGKRLVPIKNDHLTSAFDTATRQPVQLHLPAGYKPDGNGSNYGLFEWLDDDTIALLGYSTGHHDQDILTCRLSTHRCELTAPSLGRDRAYRVVQNENLGDANFLIQ